MVFDFQLRGGLELSLSYFISYFSFVTSTYSLFLLEGPIVEAVVSFLGFDFFGVPFFSRFMFGRGEALGFDLEKIRASIVSSELSFSA